MSTSRACGRVCVHVLSVPSQICIGQTFLICETTIPIHRMYKLTSSREFDDTYVAQAYIRVNLTLTLNFNLQSENACP